MVTQDAIPREQLPRVGEMAQIPLGRTSAMATVWEVYGPGETRYALVERHLHGPSDPTKPHLVTVLLSTVLPLRLMTEDQILEHLRYHCPQSPGDEWDWEPTQELYAELKRRNLAEPAIDELVFGSRSKRRQQP